MYPMQTEAAFLGVAYGNGVFVWPPALALP
jgi:hypothetical protein